MTLRNLTLDEAEAEFPDAMAEPNAENILDDKHDCLYVREDGVLVIGNHLDEFYDTWNAELGQWETSPEEFDRWFEGKADGEAALRTTDRGWRDE